MKKLIKWITILALIAAGMMACVTTAVADQRIFFPGSSTLSIMIPEEYQYYTTNRNKNIYSHPNGTYLTFSRESAGDHSIEELLATLTHMGYTAHPEKGYINFIPYARAAHDISEYTAVIFNADGYDWLIIDTKTARSWPRIDTWIGSVTNFGSTYVPLPTSVTIDKAAQVGKSGVKLYFTPMSGIKYNVYRSESPDSGFIWTCNLTNPTGKDTVYVATAGKTYYYKLRPYNEASDGTRRYGEYSNTVACEFLTAPTITSVENYATNAAKVTLTGVSGATGYALYQKKQGVGDLIWKQTVTGNTAYAYSLEPGSTVWFQVRGIVDQPDGTRGVGLASQAKSVIIPGIPKNLKGTWTAIGNTATASLNWGRVWNITGYEVYTSTSAYGTYKFVGRTTATSLKVGNLPRRTTTYFKVRSYVVLANGTVAYGSYTSPLAVVIK